MTTFRTDLNDLKTDMVEGVKKGDKKSKNRKPVDIPCSELLEYIAFQSTAKNITVMGRLNPSGDEKKKKNISKAEIVTTLNEIIVELSHECGYQIGTLNEQVSYYNGIYWKTIQVGLLENFISKVATYLGLEDKDAKYYDFIHKAVLSFKFSSYIKQNREEGRFLLNYTNGTLEIDTTTGEGTLKPHDPKDCLTYVLPCAYKENADAPLFKKFLNRCVPNMEDQYNLQEFCGSLFARELRHDKVLYLYGATGSNGKSTFMRIICNALGNENNVKNFGFHQLLDKTGTGETARAALHNKLLNACGDCDPKISDPELFKNLTAGDPITVRPPYKGEIDLPANSYARMMLCCNELPSFMKSAGSAEARRFLFIHFDQKISDNEKDVYLVDKISEAELSGVLNWMIEGLRRMIENGGKFTFNPRSNELTTEFLTESNSVLSFLKEYNIIPDTDINRQRNPKAERYTIEAKLFYNGSEGLFTNIQGEFESYRTFYIQNFNNEKMMKGKKKFWEEVKKAGFNKRHSKRGEVIDFLLVPRKEDGDNNPKIFQDHE